MAKNCGRCGGQGRVLSHLNPNAPNYGNTTFVSCPSCGGRGKTGWGNDDEEEGTSGGSKAGAHPLVWFFGLNGALFFGVLKPLTFADGFMNAFVGFISMGMAAGYLRERTWGKAVLWVVGLGIVALFAATIYVAETGQGAG